MKPIRFQSSLKLRHAARRFTRELLLCIVLPSALLLTADLIAQGQAQQNPGQAQQNPDQAQPTSAPAQQNPDQQIANTISDRLKASSVLNPLDLNVYVHQGIVTLAGIVPSQDVRQQAVDLMHSVPGVQSVEDQLTIGTPPPPSQQLESGQETAAPADQNPPENNPESQDQENQDQQNPNQQGQYQQNPNQQDQGPGQPPPPPTNPYGPAPATEPPGPPTPQQYPGRFSEPMVTIPTGTPLTVMMLRRLDTKHSKIGSHFSAVVLRDVVLLNGAISIPRGAYVTGTVIDSRPPGHLKGHPVLALQIISAQVGDTSYPLTSYIWDRRGPGKGGQTTGAVIGGAAGGALIGGAVGGGPTAALGALLGGLGGAGLSSISSGARIIVPAESVLTFYTNAPATVREPNENELRSLAGNVPANPYDRGPGPGYGPPGPYGYPPAPPPGPPGGYPY